MFPCEFLRWLWLWLQEISNWDVTKRTVNQKPRSRYISLGQERITKVRLGPHGRGREALAERVERVELVLAPI